MQDLFGKFPEIDLIALGFHVGWELEPLWIQASTSLNMCLFGRISK